MMGFIIYDAMSDDGFSGFFLCHPAGAFTIGRDGFAWVIDDLCSDTPGLYAGVDVAYSAMIQGF